MQFVCTGAKWDLRDLQSVLGRTIMYPSLGLSCRILFLAAAAAAKSL